MFSEAAALAFYNLDSLCQASTLPFWRFLFVKTGGYTLPNIWSSIIWLRAFYPRFPQPIDKVVIVSVIYIVCFGQALLRRRASATAKNSRALRMMGLSACAPFCAGPDKAGSGVSHVKRHQMFGNLEHRGSFYGWGLNRGAGFSKIKQEERKSSILCRGYFAQQGRRCLFDI